MNINKAITFSLLAHVRNTGTLIKGPVDVFVPLVKRILFLLNSKGVTKGDSIIEIRDCFYKTYFIDIPLPVLRGLLMRISGEKDNSGETIFQLFQDNAFIIRDYTFDDFEESVQRCRDEAVQVHELFEKFCIINNIIKEDSISIFKFIEKSKMSLSRYLSGKSYKDNEDFTIEAKFVGFFKNIPHAYDLIKKIYLGSILSGYLEYKTESLQENVELLLDTNFVISLLDLNTVESTHTCKTLVEISKRHGYKLSILMDTIEETQSLLKNKARYFNNVFLQSRINPEDIYNACHRRKITSVDLEHIADNLENSLIDLNINIVFDTKKYRNLAKFSKEYENLRQIRNSDRAALHDAIAIHYVRDKRQNKPVYDFEKVKSWFVHNSNASDNGRSGNRDNMASIELQPEAIKADELLNILWLSNPEVSKELDQTDIADIGLTSLVAFTLNESIPKSAIIRELDDNIQRYAQKEISDKDILLISKRIVNKQLKDIPNLNNIANTNKQAFVDRLREEADKQNEEEIEKQQKIDNLLFEFQSSVNKLKESKESLENTKTDLRIQDQLRDQNVAKKLQAYEEKFKKSEEERLELERLVEATKREQFYEKEIIRWRMKSWFWIAGFTLIFLLSLSYTLAVSDWNLTLASKNIKEMQENVLISSFVWLISTLGSGITINNLVLKYMNHSNIEAYKRSRKLPSDLK